MKIERKENLREEKCDVLVINMFEDGKTSQELANKYAIEEDKFKGKFKESYLLQTYDKIPARKILVMGMGKKEELTNDKVIELGAKITNKINSIKAETVAIDIEDMNEYKKELVEGLLIGNYKFDKYKTDKKEDEAETIVSIDIKEEDLKLATTIIEAMETARNLANEAASVMTPTKLAEIAQSLGLYTKVYSGL